MNKFAFDFVTKLFSFIIISKLESKTFFRILEKRVKECTKIEADLIFLESLNRKVEKKTQQSLV